MLHLKKDLFLVNLNVLSSNLKLVFFFFLQATDFMQSLIFIKKEKKIEHYYRILQCQPQISIFNKAKETEQ